MFVDVKLMRSISFSSYLQRFVNRLLRSIRKRTLDKMGSHTRWLANYHIYGKRFNLVRASDHAKSNVVQGIVVSLGRSTAIAAPSFIGYSPQIDLAPRALVEPKISILEYHDATVLAGTDFVLKGRACIHADLFDPARDYPMAEHFGELRIFPRRRQLVHSRLDPPVQMKEAISLLGQCAGSYAHFMTEVLPKLMIVDKQPEYDGFPILLDAWINPSFFKIIERFNFTRRKIFLVAMRQPVRAERLITVSPTAYTPPELRDIMAGLPKPRLPPNTHQFSTHAISLVRAAAYKVSAQPATWIGEKVYLRRPIGAMNMRGIVNDANIEALALRSGFDLVDPGTLSIQEQIATFRKAKVVISPIGGSLVNLMFAEPGSKIICFSAYFKDAEYDYHSQMMKALGHDIQFVVGPHLSNQSQNHHILHRDYRISMDDAAQAIEIMTGG
jgi:capsular polysaccharide biosynthesis protein